MDTYSSSSSLSLEFPYLPQVSRHQKVLEWLQRHFPDSDDEESTGARRLRAWQRKAPQLKLDAQIQKLVQAMSSRSSSGKDKVLSLSGKPHRGREVSQGEAAIQDKNIWHRPLGLEDDEESLEELSSSDLVRVRPRASHALRSPVGTNLATSTPTRAAEEEEPFEPLSLQDKMAAAPSVLSE
ncbi:hypothetical protein HGM15179_016908, partial [Zosterops borbonicus]